MKQIPIKSGETIDPLARKEIKQSLKASLTRYVSRFTYRSSHPLDLLIPKERIIRSLVGGLETSMGTTVWEPIAKTLAKLNGFEIINEKILKPHPFPEQFADELARVTSLREHRGTWISTEECANRFRRISNTIAKDGIEYVSPPSGTGVDIWIKKNGVEYAFDTKTVKPNVGGIKGFNKQILEWYAYRICKDPDVKIECKIAYPYSPTKNNFWTQAPHTSGILQPGIDALVENEFWDFLSGFQNTYECILEIFAELNREGLGRELSAMIASLPLTPIVKE